MRPEDRSAGASTCTCTGTRTGTRTRAGASPCTRTGTRTGTGTNTRTRTGVVLLALGLLSFLSMCSASVNPARVVAQAEPAPATADQAWDLFDRILGAHVDAEGRVDYAKLTQQPGELERLYLWLSRNSPETTPEALPRREDQLAYWINAYNALTLISVTRHWPIASVSDVPTPRLLRLASDKAGFFWVNRFTVGGRELSLSEIENGILRQDFDEPRIHFALVCASLGCPRLEARSFRASDLDSRLDGATRHFLSQPRGLQIDKARREISASAIFDWYEGDFVSVPEAEGSVIGWLTAHAPPAQRQALVSARAEGWPLRSLPWDWSLNAAPDDDPRLLPGSQPEGRPGDPRLRVTQSVQPGDT